MLLDAFQVKRGTNFLPERSAETCCPKGKERRLAIGFGLWSELTKLVAVLDLVGDYYPANRIPVKTQYLVEGLFDEGKI